MYMSQSLGKYGKVSGKQRQNKAFLIRTKDEVREAEGPNDGRVLRKEFRSGQVQCRFCLWQVSCIHRTSFLILFACSIPWFLTTEFKPSLL